MSLNLLPTIDPRSGFCFGVIKAIGTAEDILKEKGELYCLGQIVHNEEEVARLEKMGMKTVPHSEIHTLTNKTVLLRSHGEPPETYEILRRNNNTIVDATCPIVLKLQDRIKKTAVQGEQILIYGKKGHPEVIGLLGQINGDAQVISDFNEIELGRLDTKVTLYSQTTMSISGLHEVVEKLRSSGYEVSLKDTVCRQVSGRVEEMRNFCRQHNRILFIAGQHSSNGKVLFNECLDANPNSHKVAAIAEIQTDWFKNGESVGICGATSTPQWLMEEVKAYLLRL